MTDAMDEVLKAWGARFPDADLSALELNRRLFLAHRTLAAYSAVVLAGSELDLWEWDVLFVLWRYSPVDIAMGDLQAQLFITAGSVTHRVRHLENRGLVERRPDEANRRRVLVRLTPAGLEAAEAVAPRIAQASTDGAAQLAARGIDLPALNNALAHATPPLVLPSAHVQEVS